ncbi:MAG TPA: hypothetical protein VF840_11380 [Terriglobales bacterium]
MVLAAMYTATMKRRQVVGLALIVAGIASGLLWATGRVLHPFVPVIALFLFLAGASFFGKVGKFAEKMRPLVGKNVRVQIWGLELPGNSDSEFSVHSVQAVGPGLHVYLRPLPDGSPTHLKIAQPRDTTIGEIGVEIGKAKYVQWAGKKIKKAEGEKALVFIVTG